MSGRVVAVDILAAIFGIGSWVCLAGIFLELPLLVQSLPEGWSLPSYLSVVIQLANAGPILYSVLNNLFPSVVTEKRSIYGVLILGSIATLLISFFWSSTSHIFGQQRSSGLIGNVNMYLVPTSYAIHAVFK
jgi:riboflavin transporter 2